MLDIRTLLLVLTATQAAQCVGWLLLLRSQPRVPGAALMAIAAGFITLSAPILALRDELHGLISVVGGNVLVFLGFSFVLLGLPKLLDQRPHMSVVIAMPILASIFWLSAWILAPDDVGIRIYAASILSIFSNTLVGQHFYSAHWLPVRLRWAGLLLNAFHAASTIVRSIDVVLHDVPMLYLNNGWIQGLWYLESIFYAWFQFIVLLMVVGARLSRALMENNSRLTEEILTRQRLQEQLSATLAQESSMRREQRHFVDMVSHEFRTPLAVIDRAAEMIAMSVTATPIAPGIPQRVGSIRDAVRRLRLMIDTFLSDERLEAGAMQPKPLDLADILRTVCRQVAPDQESRIRLLLPADSPLSIRGDSGMLAIMFSNILDNALKYAPANTPVTIAATQQNSTVRVTVSDQGKGIPEKEQGMVGQRFFRASNATIESGTGLGLFTAARMAAFHEGKIELQSQPGKTIVTITLPAQP